MLKSSGIKTYKWISLVLALLMICTPILSIPAKAFASTATNFYVDGTNGNDANNGQSASTAFKTIQKAADIAVSGDKVKIMAGVYRETVTPKSDGVTFQNYNGDKVTVSGGDLVTGWTPTADAGIYSAPMLWDYQNGYGNIVYYTDAAGNDTSLSQARWPNIPDSMMFNKTKYAKFSSTAAINGTISNGGANLQMNNIALAAANPLPNTTTDAWKDALIVASAANGFVIYTGKVTGSSTTLNFEWPYTTGYLPKSASPGFGLYLTNSYQALLYDVANPITGVAGVPGVAAWYKDVANQKLYVAVPNGADPNTGKIEAKKREFAFDLAGRKGITISGINVRAAGVNFANSSNNMFKGATVEMVDSYNKPFAVDTPLSGFVSGFVLDGDHNTIRDSEIKNMFGFGIIVKGHDNNVINNDIHDFNRYGLYADGINVNGYNHLISQNSIHLGGRAAIGGSFTSTVISYNDIYDVMKISFDGGILYVVNSDFGSSEIHHNTVHDTLSGEGIYFDNLSFDAAVYNNIVWNVKVGMLINTANERMILLNNTVYNTTDKAFGHWGDAAADGIGAYGTVLMGNIMENAGFQTAAPNGAYEVLNTLDTDANIQNMFVDPVNKNFALKNPDSQRSVVIPGVTDGFTSAAPVRGAVQPGVPWKAGHNFDNAANINPTFKLNDIPYKQLLKNAGFPFGDLNGWTKTNTPEIVVHNGWDFRASGLIRNGIYGVALNEGDGIAQTVTGLKPNTTYNVSVWGKVLGKHVAATTMASGSDPVTPVNYRSMSGYMIPGTKTTLKFTGVDFGASLYDKVNFATVAASGTGKIEMYIGDPMNGGTLVATDPLSDDTAGQKGQWYYRNAIPLSAVSGTQDVYLVFSNTNTTVPLNCYFADFTLFDSTVDPATDYIELGASGLVNGTVSNKITTTTFTKGVTSRPSNFSFTTGPSDTSVTIYAKKAGGGGLTGYVDEFGLAESTTPAYPAPYIYKDGFEDPTWNPLNWTWGLGNPTQLDGTIYKEGTRSFQLDGSADQSAIYKTFGALNKVASVDFYDNLSESNNIIAHVDNSGTANLSTLSKMYGMGVNTDNSVQYYSYTLGTGTWATSSVHRTKGWHTLAFDYSSNTHVDIYIDNTWVAASSTITSFNTIALGDFFANSVKSTGNFDNVFITDITSLIPLTTDDANPAWQNTAQTVHLTVTNGLNSNMRTFYSVDDSEFVEGNTVTVDQEGIHIIKYYSINSSGGQEAVKQATVRIDLTSPVVQTTVTTSVYQSAETIIVYHSDAVNIPFVINDALSGVAGTEVKLDGAVVNQPIAAAPLSLAIGDHPIIVTAKDNAGNITVQQYVLKVTMDIHHLDEVLQAASSQGWITNHGILNSLLAKVDAVQNQQSDSTNVLNGLNALEHEVQAQSGKKINAEFADLLLSDIAYLMNQISK
ncbi:carbohydrate-binding protein [Paenibacillus sp. LMG 31458]|uniref:Carbohydrate-binding protein n=1 Tax=Paenibacillus phytorum TaxID=2654977 RepID=A0ABX1XTV9_9BACL|nr:carbohydrate-binding protein [Paenibacillus phytorum]NOU71977.1 carbohydrate-binding protein [Paenibacillus phytorum]